jgi:hypothetical protein
MPTILDYLREAFLYRGKVIFVEEDNVNINSDGSLFLIRNLILFALTYYFKSSVYETLALVNS